MATRGDSGPPREIDGLRLFEEPQDGELGRVVYQGRERPNFPEGAPHGTAHEYWIVEESTMADWHLVQAIASFDRGEGLDRHIERLVDTFPTNEAGVDAISDHLDEGIGNTVINTFDDGSIRFDPNFTKERADYREMDDSDFDRTHERCGSCVHYIPGGGCHFVQGSIDPGDYCEQFYADVGIFAHEHDGHVEINAELVGPNWDPDDADLRDFVDEIEERLEQRKRESEGSRVEGY